MKKSSFGKGCATGLVALALLGLDIAPAAAALPSYIKFDGVEGESQKDKHRGETDLISWDLHVRHVARGVEACASVRGCTLFDDIHIVNSLETSTPTLFGKLVSGDLIPTALISVTRNGESPAVFFTMLFTDVQLTDMDINSGGTLGLVSTAFSFSTITMTYREQKADGSFKTPITAFYDLINGEGSLPQLLTVFALGTSDSAPAPVPLPPTLPLMVGGLLATFGWRRRAARI